MTILNIFGYDGDIENPVSKKITLQEKLFTEDEMGIAHIYPRQNIIFVESKQGIRKKDVPIDNIAHFVQNRNNVYNFFRKISSHIEIFEIIMRSGESYDVVCKNELDSTLRYADKPIHKVKFNYENEDVYYIQNKMKLPSSIPMTDLMDGFVSAISEQ